MPYRNIDELPENTRSSLPKHAQEIYLAAFNNAWEQYRKPEDRRGDSSREEVAHKVAWAAVKQQYEKDGDEWTRKDH
jgi:cation transport regulator